MNNERIGNLLVVDDNEDVLQAARLFLKRHVASVDVESNPEAIPFLLNNRHYDVILLDMNFTRDVSSGKEGFYWLDRILEIDPSAVVILITAYGDVEMAVRAIKEGATDFVLKPWENDRLLATVLAAMKLRQSREEANTLRSQQKTLSADMDHKFQDIIGSSPAMQRVFDAIERVASTDANVLILGENGTGKELIARAIHRRSRRSEEVFVSVDLGAVAENLFESELFGHVKGAFTDAKEDRPGRFEIASSGTLFLDEIGNLSLPLQAKLLTAIQSREVTRVGSNKPRQVDIRLICATNMNLYEMIDEGDFRQDLVYRINTIEITLPPLRDRPEDIPLLAEHYLETFSKKYNKRFRGISQGAMKKMQKYNWPGNVRELQHALERAVIMSDEVSIQPEDLFLATGNNHEKAEKVNLDNYNLDDVEKQIINKVMKKHQGNISLAAKELGLTRASLYRRLEKHGL
ncbi:DNA-binding transcriptional response regulator, NtrC family, contains REC, AAA-type ATPase, and a Fis-type DNA-binding domains [Catalinimonas alkaloidigena]|uniref:DNA-binding transcriptional response regulator, NtrC family, contains REC, AAA-type ATPase, and a Fis-type DNA-binding domains n=1 Tax=Catalinimonas alkaloidigena TaxID=1075417 RepID=A0A1G9BH15_9BACT|nr:sigma-54 dependent transcriptional regulator [Catalinimonas alkaloidigena]SDK38374.1 DNA-binding transcriptional response regulator, NtrC family, contains REC, AAA-type ATPase, and a Fis-type DNA-binding domains [Catalinimonas alkaloidigena]